MLLVSSSVFLPAPTGTTRRRGPSQGRWSSGSEFEQVAGSPPSRLLCLVLFRTPRRLNLCISRPRQRRRSRRREQQVALAAPLAEPLVDFAELIKWLRDFRAKLVSRESSGPGGSRKRAYHDDGHQDGGQQLAPATGERPPDGNRWCWPREWAREGLGASIRAQQVAPIRWRADRSRATGRRRRHLPSPSLSRLEPWRGRTGSRLGDEWPAAAARQQQVANKCAAE